MKKLKLELNEDDRNRLIQMAWQDRTTFDAIQKEFGLSENQVKNIMRTLITKPAYNRWRKRVHNRKTKHAKKVDYKPIRFQGPW